MRPSCHAHLPLAGDRRGAVAIMAAVGAAMLFGAAAIVVDVGAVYGEQNRLQTVVDAAALAAAQALPDRAAARRTAAEDLRVGLGCDGGRDAPAGQATARAPAAVANARPTTDDCGPYSAGIGDHALRFGHWDAATGTFRADDVDPSVVRVTLGRTAAQGNALPTTFGRLLGVRAIDVQASATALRVSSGGLELALVLDVSWSMRGSKIADLRNVALELVDSLYAGSEVRPDLWIAVVPFSGRVNIVDYGRSWMASPPPPSSRLCTGRRSGSRDNDDSPPSVERFPPFGASFACPGSRMLGLTADRRVVRRAVEDLSTTLFTGNGTSTQVGTVWGWRALSPRWRGLWGDAELPLDYDTPDMRKAAVIMTDGRNTPWLSDDPFGEAEANAQLLAECTAMKAAGIVLYTVTFDAPAAIDPLYRDCASAPDQFYRADTAADLAAAFGAIGGRLVARPRLVQ